MVLPAFFRKLQKYTVKLATVLKISGRQTLRFTDVCKQPVKCGGKHQ